MKIRFGDINYECRDSETVLESFLRHGVTVPFSCRNGVCHACLLRSVNVDPPEKSQKGIKQTLAEKGYFMSCMCKPERDMAIALPRAADILTRAVVYKKERLSADVCRLLLEPATQLYYRAGQFINLQRADGLTRSYSLASVPHDDYYIELHIKVLPDGEMSQWIFSELKENDEIEFQGPLGDCYYQPDDKKQNILLISTGTGIAPHVGIVKDALLSGHQGSIELYHGAKKHHEHYLFLHLEDLAQKYSNFSYVLCASDEVNSELVTAGYANEIALEQNSDISDWRIYLSGRPEMVAAAEKMVITSGVIQKNIYADPFEYDRAGSLKTSSDKEQQSIKDQQPIKNYAGEERRKFPDPDPEMWQALKQGILLNKILTDFYARVFDDELLSPYFKGVTRQRLIEKVYNFLYQMFTGKKVYFGERPKNAHHWMVISDELFDYRESVMESCLRDHGLAEHLIKRWMKYEAMYRGDIVKPKAIGKVMFGEEMPLDGFEEIIIDASTLCDSCSGEISIGDLVRYHVRLGTTYCSKCMEIHT
jgi:NAD(P)H-flavin reductase/ferredoxin/truncated hemoglobin YjbI